MSDDETTPNGTIEDLGAVMTDEAPADEAPTGGKGFEPGTYDSPIPLPDLFNDVGMDWNGLKPSFDEWSRFGPTLMRMDKAHQFWLGDWFAKGEALWGEDAYNAFDPERFDSKTMANYAWVANQIPIRDRHAGLTWTHHRIAAELPNLSLRRKVLKRAVMEQLTTRQLQQVVDELKPTEDEGGRKRAKSTRTYSLSFTVNAEDENTGDVIHEKLQETLSKLVAEYGVTTTKVTPSKS